MSKKQSRVGGALALSMAQAVVLLLGYVTHLWIGRVLGPAPYGIYGVVLSVQTIIGLFLTLGIPSAVSRFVAQDEQHAAGILRQALRWQAVAAIVLAASTAAAAPLIATALGDFSLIRYLLFVPLVVLMQAFYPVYVQFLSGMHHFTRQAGLTSVYAIAKVIGAIGLLYLFGVYGAFAGFAVGGVIAAVIGYFWTKKLGGQKPIKLPVRSFLSFAGTYVLILVGLQILMSLDLFMVKAMLSDDVLAGYYNSAVTLSRISYFLLQGLAFIILPSVSALTKPGADHSRAAKFIRDVMRYLIALIIPGITLAAATSKQLLILFFSDQYVPAAPALTILMIGLGSLAFFLLLANIVAGAGREKFGLYLTVCLLLLSSALGFILIPRFQLVGAALQTAITGVVGLTVLSIYTFRVFGLKFPVKSTLNVLAATAAAVLPTYYWKAEGIILVFQYLLLLGAYVCVLLVLGEITREDRSHIAKLHPKLKWIANGN